MLDDVTFVGGSTTALLVEESAHYGVRETNDVDVIVSVTTRNEYYTFAEKLKEHGFKEDIDGPICRWKIVTEEGLSKLDVMPTEESIIGFSNRWYEEAIKHASKISLPSSTEIRVVSPEYFYCN